VITRGTTPMAFLTIEYGVQSAIPHKMTSIMRSLALGDPKKTHQNSALQKKVGQP